MRLRSSSWKKHTIKKKDFWKDDLRGRMWMTRICRWWMEFLSRWTRVSLSLRREWTGLREELRVRGNRSRLMMIRTWIRTKRSNFITSISSKTPKKQSTSWSSNTSLSNTIPKSNQKLNSKPISTNPQSSTKAKTISERKTLPSSTLDQTQLSSKNSSNQSVSVTNSISTTKATPGTHGNQALLLQNDSKLVKTSNGPKLSFKSTKMTLDQIMRADIS